MGYHGEVRMRRICPLCGGSPVKKTGLGNWLCKACNTVGIQPILAVSLMEER